MPRTPAAPDLGGALAVLSVVVLLQAGLLRWRKARWRHAQRKRR